MRAERTRRRILPTTLSSSRLTLSGLPGSGCIISELDPKRKGKPLCAASAREHLVVLRGRGEEHQAARERRHVDGSHAHWCRGGGVGGARMEAKAAARGSVPFCIDVQQDCDLAPIMLLPSVPIEVP